MFKNKSENNKKESVFVKRTKTFINNQKQYKIFESKQFIGILLIVVFSFLFVISIVQVRGLSTINSYSIGMLFGYYSYFIYVGFITLGLCYLFQIDVRIDKFIATKFNKKFHFSWLPYLFFALGFALITESIIKIVKSPNHNIFPGSKVFGDFFNDWWNTFTNNKGTKPGSTSWLPDVQNCGIIVSIFMSLLVSWSGYVVSIIIGLMFIAHFFYYIMFGSLIKQIRIKIFGDPSKKDVKNKEEFEEYKTKIMDLSFEDNSGMIEKPNYDFIADVEQKTTSINIEDSNNLFEIVDPFKDEEQNQTQFINSVTNEVNLKKNITKEFKLDDVETKIEKTPDIETFDFELDIFKTDSIDSNDVETIVVKKDDKKDIDNKE